MVASAWSETCKRREKVIAVEMGCLVEAEQRPKQKSQLCGTGTAAPFIEARHLYEAHAN